MCQPCCCCFQLHFAEQTQLVYRENLRPTFALPMQDASAQRWLLLQRQGDVKVMPFHRYGRRAGDTAPLM